MSKKIFQHILIVGLTVVGTAGCLPAETPPATDTPPVVSATTPTGTATATVPPVTATPTQTASPSPTATPAPVSFASRGETLPRRSPMPMPTFGALVTDHGIACMVGPGASQMRSGPGFNYNLIKILPASITLSALKQTADGLWLLVATTQQEVGWVAVAEVICQGSLAQLPLAGGVPTPPPTATPRAVAFNPTPTPSASPTLPPPSLASWRAEYYDNPNLTGQPVFVRDDPVLNFNWGADSPAPNIPADNFSVRWTRPFEFVDDGDYKFVADVDDGVRLYLDGWLVIDEWNTNPYTLHSGTFAKVKAGIHTITVEFFEAEGLAHINIWYEKTIVSTDKWIGEYFSNPNFSGTPVLVRADESLDFDWGDDNPVSGLPDDDFSIRWQKTVDFKPGDYEFKARIAEDDRVKIYVDDWLIVDKNKTEGGEVSGVFKQLGGGLHTIKVEYLDDSGDARIRVKWDRHD